jgi:hypothetical protein
MDRSRKMTGAPRTGNSRVGQARRVFDIIVGPLMRLCSFARDRQPPTSGNVMKPTSRALVDGRVAAPPC